MYVLLFRSIRTLLLVWLGSYTEDFREPPTYQTLHALHNFAVSSMPDSELAQKAGDWLVTFRREEELTNSVCEPGKYFGLSEIVA